MRPAVFVLAVLSLNAQVNFYSRAKEEALGAQLAAEVTKHTTPLDSAAGRAYIDGLTRPLAAALPDQTFHFTFTLVTDDLDGRTHEPKALPGGYIFVPAKLLLTAGNEAEVAGMLAHAMVHITARHYTRLLTKSELMDIGSRPVYPYNPRIRLAQLAMMRGMERQADYFAVQATASAGWDPAALAAYISRTQTDQSGSVSRVFDELPARRDRVAAIQAEMQKLPPKNYTANSDEFAPVQAEIRKLVR